MKNYYPKFESGRYYHLYNRGNNGDSIFFERKNYQYFLLKYDHYLSEFIDTFAYCLLPNHFHLLIRVKDLELSDLSEKVSEGFRKFFITFSQAINKQQGRSGSLFQKHMKRIEIEKDDYFSRMLLYIHLNPLKHNITANFETYPYSSFGSILSTKPTKLMRHEVLNWFGGMESYIDFHRNNIELYSLQEFDME